MIKATAFILIGGKSKRFGSPKWQAIINGQTVLDRIWSASDKIENRFVIGKEKPQKINKPFIQDMLEFNAPINGLYTALKIAKTDWILLLSCDLPLITPKIFEKLWKSKTDNCDIVIPKANNKTQVTCGFYHKRILPKLESEIQKKHYSLYKLLEMIETTFIDFGADDRFINMNTKADLEKIKRLS
jgi:molybdopterin-guanine dinucleotide biosynthesis protein A